MKTRRDLAPICVALFASGIAVAQESQQPVQFHIEAQPIRLALQQFGQQAGLQVAMRLNGGPAEDMKVPAVSGALTAQAALETLLKGTGLKYEFVNDRAVRISAEGDSPKNNETPDTGAALNNTTSKNGFWQRLRLAQADNTSISSTSASEDSTSGISSGQLEEIIVTAQKRAERALDVPMAITAITGDTLRADGIGGTRDLSQSVSSMAVAETGPGRQIIVIRGISSLRGGSSLTGVYLDEMPVSGAQDGFLSAYADIRAIDLERIEVLKGPQGTLFGEGAAGGVLRFLTKDPDLARLGSEMSARFYSTADGGWSEEVDGVVNVPLATNVFGIRLAAAYENTAGWIDQPSVGRENINDSEMKHARLKASFTPTSELQIKGMVEIHRNEGGGSNIVNQEPREESSFLQAFDRSAPTGYTDDYELYNLTATYDFGFAELLSSTSYAKFDSVQSLTQMNDADPVPYFEVLTRRYGLDSSITSQELRLASTRSGPIKWTLGAAYKDAEIAQDVGPGSDAVLLGGALVVPGINAGTKPASTSESWAGFADASYELFNRLEVGAGLRYFYDEREGFDTTRPDLGVRSGDFDKWTYRAYVKYRASDDVNLYVSAGTGFRSGGFNTPTAISLGAPQSYAPEEVVSYELGAKMSLLDGRVRINAAFFYSEFLDMLEDFLILTPDGVPLGFTANGQDAELKGFEWDIGWAVTDQLTLTVAGDVIDSEITRIDPANLQPTSQVGDPLNSVPDYELSASLDYSFQWSESIPGFARVSFDRQGKSYFSNRSTGVLIEPQTSAPEKDFLAARVGGEWNGWELSVYGENLLDEREILNPSTNGLTAQARPRTFGLALGKRF